MGEPERIEKAKQLCLKAGSAFLYGGPECTELHRQGFLVKVKDRSPSWSVWRVAS